ncbi:helix-turn-helix domain-containing protein [Saccharopolyspora gloriosae]|uniref:helix-turn-helix domain-containing protein n=1 Tax=Saccharopolyspora gloriosae TaxID=455344 RepID=UPI0037C8C747
MREHQRRPAILRGGRREVLAQELAELFNRGRSVQQLASTIGRRPALVRRLLVEAGVRSRSGACIGASDEVICSELAQRYRSGASVTALMEQTGLHRQRIRALLREAGLTPEPHSTRSPLPPGLIERYQAGASLRQLAQQFGRDHCTIRTMLINAGVSLRAPGRPRTNAATGGPHP